MAPLTDIMFTLDRSGTSEAQTTQSLSDGELVQAVSDEFVFDSRLTDDAEISGIEEDLAYDPTESDTRMIINMDDVLISSYQTGGSSGYSVETFDPDFLF